MMTSPRLIIGLSSDIGLALAREWLAAGYRVIGTYRQMSPELAAVQAQGAVLVTCDLSDTASLAAAGREIAGLSRDWQVLVVAPGTPAPIGLFAELPFADWAESVGINFTAQMQLIHALLPCRARNRALEPLVLLFAGGGTNNAVTKLSAYTVSKIALIKMCELLDAEIPDVRFCIIGPGWVKTKIHQVTLASAAIAPENYRQTLAKLDSDDCVPLHKVVECVDWAITAPRAVIGGRNISLVYDEWGNPALDEILKSDPNLYKLRRSGNDRLVRTKPISDRNCAEAES